MGCVSSKHVIEPLDVYRPGASIALFNLEVDHEEERLPWQQQQQLYSDHDKKKDYQVVVQQVQVANDDHVPNKPILDKLQTSFELTNSELAPKSWTEISKVLEVLTTLPGAKNPKPAAHPVVLSADVEIFNGRVIKPAAIKDEEDQMKKAIITVKEYDNFHTVEELDSNQHLITDHEKIKKKQYSDDQMIITDHHKPLVPADPQMMKAVPPILSQMAVDTTTNNNSITNGSLMINSMSTTTSKVINDNYFIVMDRMLRNSKDGTPSLARRRRIDPLEGLPEKCPPSAKDSIVLYTTSVRGVRRTFEDCRRVKLILEGYQIAFDERDVSLHGEYLSELRELLLGGLQALEQLDRSTTTDHDHEAAAGGVIINIKVPRLFIKGRYVGGVDEVMEFNEAEKLGPMLETVVSNYSHGGNYKNMNCEGCGGLRFILCLDCNGSCKVLISSTDQNDQRKDREVIRCVRCNENGLIQCPMCH